MRTQKNLVILALEGLGTVLHVQPHYLFHALLLLTSDHPFEKPGNNTPYNSLWDPLIRFTLLFLSPVV